MIKPRILFIMAVFAISCPSKTFAFNNGDFQFWSAASASFKPAENLTAKIEEEFRFGDNAGGFYYQHSDIGFTYSGLADWFDAGINYCHIFEEKNGDWKTESRPHLNAALKWKTFGANISNRLRFEYRDKENANPFWRFRSKFNIKAPWKITGLKIRPYMGEEIFYDFDAKALNKNRVYGGFNMAPLSFLKADIYYILESAKSNDTWTSINVLGAKVKLYF